MTNSMFDIYFCLIWIILVVGYTLHCGAMTSLSSEVAADGISAQQE